MLYDEKRELRLQISQLLADAGLNQHTIKEMVEIEIRNKVDRAVDQVITSLSDECGGDYIKKRITQFLTEYWTRNMISDIVKDELRRRVICVKLVGAEESEKNYNLTFDPDIKV